MTAAEQVAVLDQVLSAVEVCIAALKGQAIELDVDVARVLSDHVSGPLSGLRDALAPAGETDAD